MNRYDTLKCKFSTNAIRNVDFDYFNWSKGGGEKQEFESYQLKKDAKRPVGLNILSFDTQNGIGKIEVSSKRLERRYSELIHKDNFEYLLDKINDTKIIEFDKNSFIDSATVLRFDPCANLANFENAQNYINAISIVSAQNANYYSRAYEKSGILFNSKQKTKRVQYRVYPKHPEMLRRKNASIREFVDPAVFENVLRPEMTLTKFSEMRKVLGIDETRPIELNDILNTDKNLLYDGFSNVVAYNFKKHENELWSDQMNIMAEILSNENLTFNEKTKHYFDYFFCRFMNNDINRIEAYLSNELSGNISRYRKRYKHAIERMPTKQELTLVSHFMDELRKAA